MSGVSVTCAIGSIVNGGNATVTVAMRAFNRGGTFNVASTVTSTPLDYNTTNNAAAQSTVVSGPATPTADLLVSQTRLPNPVDFGSNVVYTVVVTNNGPSDATGVSLTSTFTSNTAQFVSATTTRGSCAPTPGRLTCGLGEMIGGASATITLTLRANGSVSLSNTAVVAGSQADPNAANNSNTLATTISNRTPVATNDSATTNEDVSGIFMVLVNDSDADNDTLTVTSVGTAAHGTTQVSGSNGVQYSPAANYFGPDSFTYQTSDGRGGTASATVNVNVLAVNDAPSFTRGADQVAGQNTGARTVEGWASAISAGPASESSQAVSFVVSNDRRALFSVQPAVSPTGTLTFTPAAVAEGVANVTVTVLDDGGTDNGGFDSSASQTFTITISAAGATTYTVTNTNDEGVGSLRAAIDNANANPAADTIAFNIEGEAPFVIQPVSVLPAITDAVTIDAATQPGFAGTPLVDIDGVNAGDVSGLTLAANNSLIRGLIVRRFANDGIIVTGTDNVIAGNYLGTDGSGSVDYGNGRYGISVLNGPNRIGGLSSEANTISNNTQGGVIIGGATPANNTVVQLNTITNNSGFGVHVALGNNNWITRNTIFGNGGLGIDLNPLGVTPNDEGDLDSGANNLQNFPVLMSATTTAGSTLVNGQFSSTPNTTFTIEVFANIAGDPGGNGEGQQYLASFPITTSASGAANFGTTLTALASGTVVSATATDASGNTSEFGTNVIVAVVEPNTAPSFVAGPNQTVPEDSGAVTVPNWATSISAGPPSESGQTLNFIVSNDNNALFAGQPSIGPGGALFIFPAANANGSATVTVQLHDNGGTANGGVDTSAPQTFTITVTPVNDAPTFTRGVDQSVVSNSGAQTVPNWATNISAGHVSEAAQIVDFQVTNNNNALFSVQPVIAPNGTLTYTPALGANGGATVTVRLHDNGGTSNGGVDLSAPQTFTITVTTTANVAPSFTAGPNQTVLEDSGTTTVPNWATAISPGPVNEAGQLVDFVIGSNNGDLFAVQPAITPNGTLTFTPVASANGSATVFVQIHDDGGNENGGVDTSAVQAFTITVTPVNDDPVAADDFTVATASVTTNFTVLANDTDVDNDTLIVTGVGAPAHGTATIAPGGGSVNYTSEIGYSGSDSFTYTVSDGHGGTATAEVHVEVSSVLNQTPVADGRSVATQEDVPVHIALTATDPDGDPLRYAIVFPQGQGLLSGTPPSVIYTPSSNYFGPDSFAFHASDNPAVESIPGLVSRWKFDVTPVDAVGSNSPSATAGLVYVPGKVALAVRPGVGGFIDVPDSLSLRLQTLTVSAWVSPSATNTTADQFGDNIISKWTLNGAAAGSVALSWRASDGRFVLVVGGTTPTVISTDGFSAGVFHHVAATYDGAVARLYVNGQPQGQTPLVTVIPYDTQKWVIGAGAFRGSSFDRTWRGAIDDLRIYSRALTSTEIEQLASELVSNTATVSITVNPVNDAPTFVGGANQSVAINSGAQSVPNWPTSISAGAANEAPQVLDFQVTNNNNALFSVQPAIAPNGTLTYTPASGASGTATVTVRLHDSGGIANGGVDLSAPQTFTITVVGATTADLTVSVTEPQDPIVPALQFGNVAIVNNLGPATATNVVFTLDLSANGTLHSVPDGCVQSGVRQLTCTTASMASGGFVAYSFTTSGSFGPLTATGTVTSSVTDPNLANNTAAETTTINTPPTSVEDNATTASAVSVLINVLANDQDPDVASGDVLRIATIGGAQHGIVSTTTGSPFVRYTPEPGYTGPDSFTYSVGDTAGAASAPTTVTVLVTEAHCVAEPADLISWWPGHFDVNAPDIRGGNAGTPQGNVQMANGIVGTAFSFDRSLFSGIRVPHAANLNPTANQVTMAAWVRPAATVEDYQSVVRKTNSYSLGLSNNAAVMCEIGTATPLVAHGVQAGQWSHVVCTYDGAVTRIYIDGAQVAQANNELGIALNTNALMIGGDAISPSNEFNGLIDEVQIFNRALPVEDILTIVGAGDAGVCEEQPVVVTNDSFVVTSDTSATINPSSNDRDTGSAFPSVLATVRGLPVGTPQLWLPGDIGVVNSTGLAYFSGGLVAAAATGAIAILDTNTQTIVGTMAMPVPSSQTLARVNQSTNIVYMRGTNLNAVDGRPGSPTFNQVIMSLSLGNIQSMALDEVRGRLYLTAAPTSPPARSSTAGSSFSTLIRRAPPSTGWWIRSRHPAAATPSASTSTPSPTGSTSRSVVDRPAACMPLMWQPIPGR